MQNKNFNFIIGNLALYPNLARYKLVQSIALIIFFFKDLAAQKYTNFDEDLTTTDARNITQVTTT